MIWPLMLQSYIECFCLSFLLLFKPADFCQICVKVMLSPKTNGNSFFKHKFVELFIFLQLNLKKINDECFSMKNTVWIVCNGIYNGNGT